MKKKIQNDQIKSEEFKKKNILLIFACYLQLQRLLVNKRRVKEYHSRKHKQGVTTSKQGVVMRGNNKWGVEMSNNNTKEQQQASGK
jgi:hypothetical protein